MSFILNWHYTLQQNVALKFAKNHLCFLWFQIDVYNMMADYKLKVYFDELVQERCNSIVKAPELPLSCTNLFLCALYPR